MMNRFLDLTSQKRLFVNTKPSLLRGFMVIHEIVIHHPLGFHTYNPLVLVFQNTSIQTHLDN